MQQHYSVERESSISEMEVNRKKFAQPVRKISPACFQNLTEAKVKLFFFCNKFSGLGGVPDTIVKSVHPLPVYPQHGNTIC